MIKLSQVLVVEGKYDKIKCSQIFDCLIVETNGFGIFKDKQKMEMLRKLGKKNGLILLTDSDSAGFKIRNYIISSVGKEYVQNVYMPDLYGKERRKTEFSKEAKLGVEGISDNVIIDAFEKAGILGSQKIDKSHKKITKTLLYLSGLSGTDDSAVRRKVLLGYLDLPEKMSVNTLVGVLNTLMSKDQFEVIIEQLFGEKGK